MSTAWDDLTEDEDKAHQDQYVDPQDIAADADDWRKTQKENP